MARVRRLSGQQRIGHTGTLDPAATGLLVLCLGTATRLVEYLTGHDKRYEGVVTLGMRTDTDDAEGAIVAEAPVPDITPHLLESMAAKFTGPLLQRPPAYSAVQVGGKRAYDAARAGKPLDLPPRPVTVYQLRLRAMTPRTLAIDVHCGPGTYIRSLARDIGEELGCGAHLSALRRVSAGRFDVSEAFTLPDIQTAAARDELPALLLPPDEGLIDWPALILSEQHATHLWQGSRLDCQPETGSAPGTMRAYAASGEFLGVADLGIDGTVHATKMIRYPLSSVMSPPDTRVH